MGARSHQPHHGGPGYLQEEEDEALREGWMPPGSRRSGDSQGGEVVCAVSKHHSTSALKSYAPVLFPVHKDPGFLSTKVRNP